MRNAHLEMALVRAISEKADLEVIQKEIRHMSDLDKPIFYALQERVPLVEATVNNLPEVVDELLAKGADLNNLQDSRGTPLVAAMLNHQIEMEDHLLEKPGLNLNAYDPSRNNLTPLLVAISQRRESLMTSLLARGANPNQVSRDVNEEKPTSPLSWSIRYGRSSAVHLLLEKGANARQANPHGVTPLEEILAYPTNLVILAMLLRHGADPNEIWASQNTPLCQAVKKGYREKAQVLLKFQANPNQVSPRGETPLQLSMVNSKDTQMTELLLTHGANSNGQSSFFSWRSSAPLITPLGRAILLPSLPHVQLLLKFGANPNQPSNGVTPLVQTIVDRKVDMAAVLLEKGAQANQISSAKGLSYFSADRETKYHRLTATQVTPLMAALLKRDSSLVELLLKHRANPRLATRFTETKLGRYSFNAPKVVGTHDLTPCDCLGQFELTPQIQPKIYQLLSEACQR